MLHGELFSSSYRILLVKLYKGSVHFNSSLHNIQDGNTNSSAQMQIQEDSLVILTTNVYLHYRQLNDSNLCTFCSLSKESIEHLFFECTVVRVFWDKLRNRLKEKCAHCDNFELCTELVVFGVKNGLQTDPVLDLLLLMSKYFIYRWCLCLNKQLNLPVFLAELKNR